MNNRHLFGLSNNNFEDLMIQNMLKFDVLDSIEDYDFRVSDGELKLFKGNNEIFAFSENNNKGEADTNRLECINIKLGDAEITTHRDLDVTPISIDYGIYSPYDVIPTQLLNISNIKSYEPLSKVNIGYFPDYAYNEIDISTIPAEKFTHIILGFMWAQPTQTDYNNAVSQGWSYSGFYDSSYTEGILTFRNKDDTYNIIKELKGLRQKYPHLKVGFSLGGANLSWNLSKVMGDVTLRDNLVKSIVSFLIRNDIDFVDIDWEYPRLQTHAWDYYDPTNDIPNFILFLQELRSLLNNKSPDKYKQITIAIGNYQSLISQYNGVSPYVDLVFLMTYDFAGHTYNGTNPMTSLDSFISNNDRYAKKSVEFATTLANIPLHKICIATASYGIGWESVTPPATATDYFGTSNSGPAYNFSSGAKDGIEFYDNIVSKIASDSSYVVTYGNDANSMVYLAKDIGSGNYEIWSYENEVTAGYKADYVIETGLAGCINWELTKDTLSDESTSIFHALYTKFLNIENSSISLFTNSVERVRISNSGNVGINNINPSKTLDVLGDINFTGTLFNNGINFGGRFRDSTIITIGLTNSGANYEISASGDIGSLITSLITTDNVIIHIYQGDYTLTTSIVINNNDVKIEGMHRENTKIVSNFTNDNIIEIKNSSGGGVSISNVTISNLTLSNTSYLNYGVIGIYCNGMRNCNIKDINIQQCYTALKLDDRNFFNDIETLRTTHCYDTLILDGPGSSNKPNQNTFSKCLFNNNQNDILLLNRGNNNFFNHCSFEVWTGTAVYVDDSNGNTFNSCRYEPAIAVTYYINLTSNSRDNVFNNSYFTDNNLSWVDFDTSINDNGEGNCVDSLNSFKTQRVRWKRRHANSENFIEFIRTGYGDDTSILTLDDQYSSSGNPIQLSLKSSRLTGKFISGNYNSTENFYVGNNGDTFIGGLLSFSDNDTGFEGVSDGVFRIMNDNSETMRFNSDGKIGIGSNNPDEILHIEGDSPILKISNTQETWSGIRFCDSGAPTTENFDILYNSGNQDLKIRSDNLDNIMYFEYNNGFIGLGLDDPTCPIHLNNTNGTLMKLERTGSVGDGLYTELKNPAGTRLLMGIGGSGFTGTDDTACIIGNWSDGDLELRTNGTRRMTIKADGKIGINTASPNFQFQVNGDAKVNGEFTCEKVITTGTINPADDIEDIITGPFAVRSVNSSTTSYLPYKEDFNESTTTTKTARETDGSYHNFLTENTSRLYIDSSGNVGIGTTTPTEKITIDGNIEILGLNDLLFRRADGTAAATISSNTEGLTISESRGSNATSMTIGSDDIEFLTNNTERMRIDSSGNVGIGTSNPTITLAIGDSDTGIDWISDGNLQIKTNNVGRMYFDNSGRVALGDITNPTISLAIGDSDTGLDWKSDGEFTIQNNNVETMRFNSDNKVGVGMSGNPSAKFEIYNPNTEAFRISMDDIFLSARGMTFHNKSLDRFILQGDGDCENRNNSYTGISDERIKKNITPCNSQWEDIKNIEVVNFNFINEDELKHIGVVAQQVETISPGLIKNTDGSEEVNGELVENIKSVKYSILYMKSIKALQEAQLRIETLEIDNDILKTQFNEMENYYENIKLDNSILKTQMTDILMRLQLLENK